MSVPPELRQDLEGAFFLFDYDNSKKVSVGEVGPVIRSVGLNPTEVELKAIVEAVQAKFGGHCSVDQLAQILSPRLGSLQTTQSELKDALLAFDKSGNNTIYVNDLMTSLTSLGESLPSDIVDEMIREVDLDGEGQVNIDDVVKLLLKK